PHKIKPALEGKDQRPQPKTAEESHFQGLELLPPAQVAPEELPEPQYAQNGQAEFQDHLDGGHRAEFAGEGKMIDQQVREQGEVLAPGQEQGQQGPEEQPPFGLSLDQDKAQDEQKQDDRPHIGRAGHNGLFPPIEREVSGQFQSLSPRQALSGEVFVHLGVPAQVLRPRAPEHSGDKEVQGFGDPITVLGDVGPVQAGSRFQWASVRGQGQGGFSPGAPIGIFLGGHQPGGIGGNGQDNGQDQEADRGKIMFQFPFAERIYQVDQPQDQDQQHKVIGHLVMVGPDFQGHGQGGQDKTGHILFPEHQHDPPQNHGD